MRILNIISSIDPEYGGPIEGALRLAEAWTAAGHHVDLVTLDSPRAPYVGRAANVVALGHLGTSETVNVGLPLHKRFGYSDRYVPWLRANVPSYDGVIVHGLWNYSTLAARRVLVGGRTPYFLFPHGALDPWFKSAYPIKHALKSLLWPFSEGVLMNNASAVLFTTEEERRLADRIFWPYHVRPAVVGFGSSDVPSGAAQQERAFRDAVPELGDAPYLLFLSRIHAKKGCDLLIRAFAKVAAQRRDLRLVMAGPDQTGWRSELEAIAGELGVARRVHWTGTIAGDVKWGAYRGCEAFALTSHTENFGIVVAEALACAKPVLITDKVNLWREVVADGAGFVEPDTQEGANRLLERFLATGEAERSRMGALARACYEKHFRFESTAEAIVALIEKERR